MGFPLITTWVGINTLLIIALLRCKSCTLSHMNLKYIWYILLQNHHHYRWTWWSRQKYFLVPFCNLSLPAPLSSNPRPLQISYHRWLSLHFSEFYIKRTISMHSFFPLAFLTSKNYFEIPPYYWVIKAYFGDSENSVLDHCNEVKIAIKKWDNFFGFP